MSEGFYRELESEAVAVLREVAANFRNPHLLFSGGKDSIVLAHLAKKAFTPAPCPFPLLHIDTGHNFPETIEFRDRFVEKNGYRLVVKTVQESIDKGRVQEEVGKFPSRNALQSVTLMDAIHDLGIDVAIGGARRDEEKARAKERFFSIRRPSGEWDPRNQRPEIWKQRNLMHLQGEHFRVFPLNNWTELDVWTYIREEGLEIPEIYFSHRRQVVPRSGSWMAVTPFTEVLEEESPAEKSVRFRTIGDATCTGAVESTAQNIEDIIQELRDSRQSERSTRIDDRRSDSAMEDRKAKGYF